MLSRYERGSFPILESVVATAYSISPIRIIFEAAAFLFASEKRVLFASRELSPQIREGVDTVAERYAEEMPSVCIACNQGKIAAYYPLSAEIILDKDLEILSAPERNFVIAHELAHHTSWRCGFREKLQLLSAVFITAYVVTPLLSPLSFFAVWLLHVACLRAVLVEEELAADRNAASLMGTSEGGSAFFRRCIVAGESRESWTHPSFERRLQHLRNL